MENKIDGVVVATICWDDNQDHVLLCTNLKSTKSFQRFDKPKDAMEYFKKNG